MAIKNNKYSIAFFIFPEFQVLKQISLIGISSRIESILAIQWLFDLFIFNSKNITSGIMFYSVFNTFPILFLSIIPKDKIKNVKIFKSLI